MDPKTPTSEQLTQSSSRDQVNNTDVYPTFTLEHIQNPNRFFAIPLVGGFIKLLILLPVFIAAFVYGIGVFFINIINSFIVLFTGEYWHLAYSFNLSFMTYYAKIFFYWVGLTNEYPGIILNTNRSFSVQMEKPQNPNRFFAIPIFGGLAKFIILIPYFIYSGVLLKGAGIGAFFSTFPIIFVGRYPESTYEFGRDSLRVNLAQNAYLFGLSDTYPSFYISMHHKAIKILLIILGIITPNYYLHNSNTYHYYYNSNAVTGIPYSNQNTNLPGGVH